MGRNVTSYGVYSLNKSPRLQAPKSRMFVLFTVSGKQRREAGWQIEEYVKSCCACLLSSSWMAAASCAAQSAGWGGLFPGVTPAFCLNDKEISQGRAQGKTHFWPPHCLLNFRALPRGESLNYGYFLHILCSKSPFLP